MIINESDAIMKSGRDKSFFNLDLLVERDHMTFNRIKLPGIDR